MTTLRVLIVDDEAHARERLRRLLDDDATVDVVGECASGAEAVAAVSRLAPDLMLLDVQMPELDGLEVVRAIPAADLPLVIFVTAYDEHAVEAFDLHAVDYVLKPAEGPRLFAALARARLRVRDEAREQQRDAVDAVMGLREGRLAGDRLLVRHDGQLYPIRAREIIYIEAEGNYARLHLAERTFLVRETMTHLEQRLDPSQFARIHRSTIVNLDAIKELQPWFGGDYIALLKNGAKLKASRFYRPRLERWTLG